VFNAAKAEVSGLREITTARPCGLTAGKPRSDNPVHTNYLIFPRKKEGRRIFFYDSNTFAEHKDYGH